VQETLGRRAGVIGQGEWQKVKPSVPRAASLPMIQDNVLVRDRRPGRFQFTEGANDVVRLHSVLLRVVMTNYKNAGVSAFGFLDK
jgi:hypothetical protein